jgi:hypothetical protein
MPKLVRQAEGGLYGKRSLGLTDVYEAIKADLAALRSFLHHEDAGWRVLFHPTTLCMAFVIVVCGIFAVLQLLANAVAWVSK